jgi:ABC-type Fe3+/spermidine/putrescine transport system ATPase subunit
MSDLVKLKSVSKTFDTGTQAIAALDLDVREGELLSLVGVESPRRCGSSRA